LNFSDIKPGIISFTTAFGASWCCVLPMAVVFLGLGSGAFMTTTMQFRPVLYPLGLIGLSTSYYLYFRRKKACAAKACQLQGRKINLTMLILSSFMMISITYVDFFITKM